MVHDEEKVLGVISETDLMTGQAAGTPGPPEPGVVTLTGQLEGRSECAMAVEMCRQTDGVVAVVDHLTHHFDDSWRRPDEPAPEAITGNRLRRL